MAMCVQLTALDGIPTVTSGADLPRLISVAAERTGATLRDDDILVVAQKIVSKAEGRLVHLADVQPSESARELARRCEKDPRVVELILQESSAVLRTRPGAIIVVHRLGLVLANAGIDGSNVEAPSDEEAVLLLPADPDASAERIRAGLQRINGVDLAVIINDSFGRAWRLGTVGTAIGVSGCPGLLDLRGTPDRNRRALRITEVGIADEMAAAASILMGQAAEGRPVVLIRGLQFARHDGNAAELIRPAHMDMFR
jgi:coenzyme F420-0:L-glutamate ligase / coenzyme F420-1:gamma-L-glutamate ligase